MDTGTRILHVDMDAFYASVAVLDDPSLRGRPVIVGAPDSRSVVSSASYGARRYGVRAAMPVARAKQLCPSAVFVSPEFERYREVSSRVRAIFDSFTPLVEPLSIDEAFLDVAGVRRLWGSPGEIAVEIRRRVAGEVGISCSIGVAATKHVAKMASTAAKPDGLLIVPAAQTLEFLDPRPVSAMWGVGPRAAEALESRGIRRIRDIRAADASVLERAVGAALALRLRELAAGRDSRRVTPGQREKSISHEDTFSQDIGDPEELRAELLRLGDRVAARLRAERQEAGVVTIKVRFADFTTITRSQTLTEPSNVSHRLGTIASDLFAQVDRRDPVRLLGVRAERLTPEGMGGSGLWDDDSEHRLLDTALDRATERFGAKTITRARHVARNDGRDSAARRVRNATGGPDGATSGATE